MLFLVLIFLLFQPLYFFFLLLVGLEGTLLQVLVYGFPCSCFGLSMSQLLSQEGKGALQFIESFALDLATFNSSSSMRVDVLPSSEPSTMFFFPERAACTI